MNTDIAALISKADTLPKLLRHNAENYGSDIALREKDLGIWRRWTWLDYNDHVRRFALGLRALGVGEGDVVALIGDNRPDWIAGEIAAHAVKAMTLGIYRDALEEEVAYLINYGEAKAIFAEDEEQVDKLLNLGDRIPSLRYIIYSDPRGMRKYDDPRLLSVEDIAHKAHELGDSDPGLYNKIVDATDGQDPTILCTTSGTTANPKLAMLTSAALLHHCAAYLEADPKGPLDEYVSVLPLPWIMEQIYALGKALISRMTVNFVEEPDTMMHDFREIAPTFVLFAPRLWESIAADVRSRIMDTSPLKRALYNYGLSLGLKALKDGRRSWLADAILFRALRDRLGFTRLTSAATGGAALGPDTFRFFQAIGVPLRQLYGQTELLGAYTIHAAEDVDFDTVGVGFEGVEIKIKDPDPNGVGEVVTRHPNMFTGYYKNPEETAADMRNGWMHTGDAGYFNEAGHLVVIDRIKDLAVTAHGDRYSPQFIENKLKFSPFVAETVILGADRDYLAAMICIRFSIVSKWAEKNRIAFTTYSDLSARPEVYELLRKEVETVNASLPPAQKITKFILLYKELDADDGELTRTRKVRRGVIGEKYGGIIDAIYSGNSSIDIDTVIHFQDGTTQRIQTKLPVAELDVSDSEAEPAKAA